MLRTRLLFLPLLLISTYPQGTRAAESPHLAKRLTWQVISQTGETVWQTTAFHTPFTWWPNLHPDLCQLAAGSEDWDIPTTDPMNPRAPDVCQDGKGTCKCSDGRYGCGHPEARKALSQLSFYVCPRDGRDRKLISQCGGYESYFCKAWGCETTGNTYWKPSSTWDLIRVKRTTQGESRTWRPLTRAYCWGFPGELSTYWEGEGPCINFTCNPLNISFTQKGRGTAQDWIKGKTWGLRFFMTGQDQGFTFMIKLKIEEPSASIGPNQVLADQKRPSLPAPAPPRATTRPNSVIRPSTAPNAAVTPVTLQPPRPGTGDRLLNLIEGAYSALNVTSPNRTQECWLCLVSTPPYYEGVAVVGSFTNSSSPPSGCASTPQHKLTISEVSGQGPIYQGTCFYCSDLGIDPTIPTTQPGGNGATSLFFPMNGGFHSLR